MNIFFHETPPKDAEHKMTTTGDDREDGTQWLRLELMTRRPDADAASIVQLGALGIEVRDGDTYMENASFAPVPDGYTRLIAYFDADRTPGELRAELERAIDGAEVVSVSDYGDRSWETAWMSYFEALELSSRVRVGPPWDRPEPLDDGVSLVIEPGMAFGTGSHETTRLCIRLIDDIVERRSVQTMLDVGCGSAILSMVAAGLGVRRAVGIDVDATAIEVARKNRERNGFSSHRIALSTRPLSEIEETFELVVANILAPVLLELRHELLDAVAPGGELVLSGIPAEQSNELRTAFARHDYDELELRADGQWVALHLARRMR